MSDATRRTRLFYDSLAPHFHLIFADWEASLQWQRSILAGLLGNGSGRVLDMACGMGTQALGLALDGHAVVARDLSPELVARLAKEARDRSLAIDCAVHDMRAPDPAAAGQFDVVLAFDNALPHLDSDADLLAALTAARDALAPGGVFLASVRDYDRILEERPRFDPARVFGEGPDERIVLQLWTWRDERRYTLEVLLLTRNAQGGFDTTSRTGVYRAVRRAELLQLARDAGFTQVEWLTPEDSGFYQPILRASQD